MPVSDHYSRCFLAEWYQPGASGHDVAHIVGAVRNAIARASGHHHRIQLLIAVAAPDDEMLYIVFAAPSLERVTELCQQAGWPLDRVTNGARIK